MRTSTLTAALCALVLSPLTACSGDEPAPPDKPEEPVGLDPAPQRDTAPPPVKNEAPKLVKAQLFPPRPNGQQDLVVQVETSDADGDPVDIDYEWSKNGEVLIAQKADTLPKTEHEKGDEIKVKITISDETHESTRDLAPVTIANAPPTLLTDPGRLSRIDGFRIQAADPDGDSLTWKLEGAPKGMSIRASGTTTGELAYKGSEEEPGGAYQVKIIGDDGDGGTLEWSFGIEVSPGSAAPKE